jgi:hypothetical protein
MKKMPNQTAKQAAPPLPPHHPDVLLQKAETMPWKTRARVDLNEYIKTIYKLKDHGYSYAEIAGWLNEQLADRLGQTPITRAQVYRAHQQAVIFEQQNALDVLEHGGLPRVPGFSDEQAEKEAAEADGKAGSETSPT